jgi:hypothetical protein
MPPKISLEQYEFFLQNNIPYTGYVIGLGYADLASGCILPETFGMFNPPRRAKSYNDSFCQSFFVPTVDTSPYMYAKSLDISVEDITSIITKVNANNILVYLGNGKGVSVPKNDSSINITLVDDGSDIYIEIKVDSPSSLFAPKISRIRLLDFLEEYKNGSINTTINQKTSGQMGVTQTQGDNYPTIDVKELMKNYPKDGPIQNDYTLEFFLLPVGKGISLLYNAIFRGITKNIVVKGASSSVNYYTSLAIKSGASAELTGARVQAGFFVQTSNDLGRILMGLAPRTLYSNSAATIIGRAWQNQAIGEGLMFTGVGTGSLIYHLSNDTTK